MKILNWDLYLLFQNQAWALKMRNLILIFSCFRKYIYDMHLSLAFFVVSIGEK